MIERGSFLGKSAFNLNPSAVSDLYNVPLQVFDALLSDPVKRGRSGDKLNEGHLGGHFRIFERGKNGG